MSRSLNSNKLERKYSLVTNTKESIQYLSGWIIQHNDAHNAIVKIWLKTLRNAEISHRLTLFYVANDVIQHRNKPIAAEYRVVFSPAFEEAIPLVRSAEIKEQIRRIISVWNDRNIFSPIYLEHLMELLQEEPITNIPEKGEDVQVEPEKLAAFRLKNLVSMFTELTHVEKLVTRKEVEIKSFRNFTLPQTMTIKMSTSYTNKKIMRKMDKMTKLLEEYIELAEKKMALQKSCYEQWQICAAFHALQNTEVKKIANAYKLFDKKLHTMKDNLELKIPLFPNVPTIGENNFSAAPSFLNDDSTSSSYHLSETSREPFCNIQDSFELPNSPFPAPYFDTKLPFSTDSKSNESDYKIEEKQNENSTDVQQNCFNFQIDESLQKTLDSLANLKDSLFLNFESLTENFTDSQTEQSNFDSDCKEKNISDPHQDSNSDSIISSIVPNDDENKKLNVMDVVQEEKLDNVPSDLVNDELLTELNYETNDNKEVVDRDEKMTEIEETLPKITPKLVEKDLKTDLLNSIKMLNKLMSVNTSKANGNESANDERKVESTIKNFPLEFVLKIISHNSCERNTNENAGISKIDKSSKISIQQNIENVEEMQKSDDFELMDMDLDSE